MQVRFTRHPRPSSDQSETRLFASDLAERLLWVRADVQFVAPEKAVSDRPLYASKQTLSETSPKGLLVTQADITQDLEKTTVRLASTATGGELIA
jgi:hypothetical protein